MHRSQKISTRGVHLALFYISALTMIAVCSFGIYVSSVEYEKSGKLIIGEVIVNMEFPSHGAPKIVSYLMVSSVMAWYCIVKLVGAKLSDTRKSLRSLLQLVILISAVVSLYEFIYNSIIWNSLVTHNLLHGELNLHDIIALYPNRSTPWNLVFAMKMTFAAFLISAHAFYILSKSRAV